MKILLTVLLATLSTMVMATETVNFDNEKAGDPPSGWITGVTGKGLPQWRVETDPTAPSKPNLLKQSGYGTYPWCVKKTS